jgi:hypothetical protein
MVTLEEAKKLMENEINRAKKLLTFGHGIDTSRWLEATPEHSFGKEEHMVKIIVLEGSPPKGYILADCTYGLVKAFRSSDLRTMKTLRAYKKGEALGLNQNSNQLMEENI